MPFVFDPILRQKNHSRMDDGIKAILAGESGSRYHLVDVRNRVIDEIHPFESLLTRPNLECVKVRKEDVENGYRVDHIFNIDQCEMLLSLSRSFLSEGIEDSFSAKEVDGELLVKVINDCGALRSVIDAVDAFTGVSNYVWNVKFVSKSPSSRNHADLWHYDNHYPRSCTKVLIYLNPQLSEQGSTELVDAKTSYSFSKTTQYIGLLSQRKMFQQFASKDELQGRKFFESIYRFVPSTSGAALIFHSSKCLHRAIPPLSGERHALAFSLMPLLDKDLEAGVLPEKISLEALQSAQLKKYISDYVPILVV